MLQVTGLKVAAPMWLPLISEIKPGISRMNAESPIIIIPQKPQSSQERGSTGNRDSNQLFICLFPCSNNFVDVKEAEAKDEKQRDKRESCLAAFGRHGGAHTHQHAHSRNAPVTM